MASNDLEVLDPAAPVEKVMEIKSGNELDRRHFFAALGSRGRSGRRGICCPASPPTRSSRIPTDMPRLTSSTSCSTSSTSRPPCIPTSPRAPTFPASTYVTLGTGQVFNQPAKITFSSQQITDIFNEMYYDELNQLIAPARTSGSPSPTARR